MCTYFMSTGSQKEEGTKIRLLLLGTGESGKSTFIRQMRIIYDKGYTEEERRFFISGIMDNILSAMKAMVAAMNSLNIDYELHTNKRNAELIASADSETFACSLGMYILAIKDLWQDIGVQECYRNRNKYQIIDSAKYFLENIDRIAEPSYLPTDGDILHVRIKTTGLIDYHFTVENVRFQMTDVEGQRSERRKWIHCFDNVKAIIFLTAISEYDQVLPENDQQNRLVESKSVFKSLHKFPWFADTSTVVFFNKIDLLREKIMYSDLEEFFPEYTDTTNIKVVFSTVHDSILRDRLTEYNLC
ncbi:guanine nucleotide-binding protein subunit alpha-11-like [Musca vetustissima]|uniref:guanine nucleotide-binding protein subunit alpha-11-like n=1 Tax=Musca vetustissima TaxID=27455 RepID=UPI002AB7AD04|nr:guanine nucleotide-binding protein subunit alpha-11-like [Musca vetustissima]